MFLNNVVFVEARNKMPMTPDEVVKNLEMFKEQIERASESRKVNGEYEETYQALQSAISLLQDYQKLRERVSVEKILKIIEDNLECKDDDVIGCHINGKNASAQAIITYLQQPTEH
jgi:superfamily II RNA helicase